jgi:hypothetical protein
VSEPTDAFEKTLAAIGRSLEGAGIPHALVGGLAVLVHGVARLTRDVDVLVLLDPDRTDELLDALGASFQALPEDPTAFVEETRVLPAEGPDGSRVDFIFAGLPFEEAAIARAREESLGGVQVKVCTAEDLIVMKIVSDRPRDREDVEGIVKKAGPGLDRDRLDPLIAGIAQDLERPDILTFWRSLTTG